LDVDGTLVDTNYHHTLAWYRAFRGHGIVLPMWRLHRHVGMGGDKFVAAVAGDETEERLGDVLREEWERLFDELLDEVEPVEGARELMEELKARGLVTVLASSAVAKHVEAFVEKLDAGELADAWTTKDEVERSKPEPDLGPAALERAGSRDAVMVGDTPWDVAAARRAGLRTICVITGGYSEQELRAAGADGVFESVAELRRRLDETPFAAA
jgi:HAD superfamily hydrolase (TIGR01509 family)